MFGLVIFKRKNDKENTLQKPSQISSEEKQEKIIVDVDYDKLADAIVRANNTMALKEKEDKAKSIEKQNKIQQDVLGNGLKRFFKLLYLKDEDAEKISGLGSFVSIFNRMFFQAFESISRIVGIILGIVYPALLLFNFFNHQDNFLLKQFILMALECMVFFLIGLIFIFISNISKATRFEMDKINDLNIHLNVFTSMTSLVAMIVAVVALFIGGSCNGCC